MSKIVYFKPLEGIGEAPIDLDSCPRPFLIVSQHEQHPDFPEEAGLNQMIYKTLDGRWVEHDQCYCQFEGWSEHFAEVNPRYVAECLMAAGLKLAPELVPHWDVV